MMVLDLTEPQRPPALGADVLADARKSFPPMWVIYDHPSDYPQYFVARLWFGTISAPDIKLCSNLALLRDAVASTGASYNLGRSTADDPAIVELWI